MLTKSVAYCHHRQMRVTASHRMAQFFCLGSLRSLFRSDIVNSTASTERATNTIYRGPPGNDLQSDHIIENVDSESVFLDNGQA